MNFSEVSGTMDKEDTTYVHEALDASGYEKSWTTITEMAAEWTYWSNLRMDFLGPIPSGDYTVEIIYDYGQCLVIEPGTKTTMSSTIFALKKLLTRFGLLEILTVENDPQFTDSEMIKFCANAQQKTSVHNTIFACLERPNWKIEPIYLQTSNWSKASIGETQ